MRKLIIIAAILLISGCASDPKLPRELTFTPASTRAPNLEGVKTVALFEFDNLTENKEAGARVLGKLSACLAGSRFFRLAERKQLEKVIEEIALGMSDAFAEGGYLKAGQLVGADAVLVGEITGFSATAEPLDYTYSRPGVNMLPIGPGASRHGPLGLPGEKRTYQVMRFSAGVSFNGRLIDAASGRVLYSAQADRGFAAREGEYGINSEVSLLDELLDLAVRDFCYPFNPEAQ